MEKKEEAICSRFREFSRPRQISESWISNLKIRLRPISIDNNNKRLAIIVIEKKPRRPPLPVITIIQAAGAVDVWCRRVFKKKSQLYLRKSKGPIKPCKRAVVVNERGVYRLCVHVCTVCDACIRLSRVLVRFRYVCMCVCVMLLCTESFTNTAHVLFPPPHLIPYRDNSC